VEPPPRPLELFPPSTSQFELDEYIFPKYMSFTNKIDIKNMFIANSEIQLHDFLRPEVFSMMQEELSSDDVKWETVGPANIR